MSAENALPQEETPNSAAGGAPTADYSIGDGATAKLLPGIQSPADLQNLSYEQLEELSKEIRQFIVTNVSATGGHLGPNLGVVELTLGIHRVLNLPRTIFFSTPATSPMYISW